MSTDGNSSIQQQKSDISNGFNTVDLAGSCIINHGILRLSEEEQHVCAKVYEDWSGKTSFFIPASGSGSRMFAELVNFIESGIASPIVIDFFKELPNLALFQELPIVVREKYASLQPIYLAEYLISQEGMKVQDRPKGLIPFHKTPNGIYNPFQDQFVQAMELLGENGHVHFTIQKDFESAILDSLKVLDTDDLQSKVSFSHQESESDAYCFDDHGNLVEEKGKPVRRPAGHGALLKNLNKVDADLMFVKNIDNVQHASKAELNQRVWKYCAGLLLSFKQELAQLLEAYTQEALQALNKKYQFLSKEEEQACNADTIEVYAARPSRVCGMVVNEGAPGGGPFWVNDNGVVSKQIVEKVQISDKDKAIVEQSSHFNPVFIALSKTDVFGNTLDLEEFVDPSKYLVVKKPHRTGVLNYRELPGLWNGSMHNWNTVFLEIPKEVFSPVKSVFDLLHSAHKAE